MSLSPERFDELVRQIKEQVPDEQLAVRFANLIGEKPVYDNQRKIMVIDCDEVVAALHDLPFFDAGAFYLPPEPKRDWNLTKRIVRELMGVGYDEKKAIWFTILILDRPVRDLEGKYLVVDEGKEIARVNISAAVLPAPSGIPVKPHPIRLL